MTVVHDRKRGWLWPVPLGWAVATAGLLGLGCTGEEPRVYRVPKEPTRPATATTTASSPHGSPVDAAFPSLRWTTPEGWVEHGSSGMSLVDFTVGDQAGVSIIPLPSRGVRDAEVMNIFRQRFKLPDLDAAGLAALGREVPGAPTGTVLYDMSPETEGDGPRLVIAVVPHMAARWYVRLSGAARSVEQQKTAFIQFLGSLEVGETDDSARELVAAPAVSSREASTSSRAGTLPEWTVPGGWKEVPPTAMLLARYLVGEEAAEAEITVSVFPGDVGGAAANVNRWRGQIGLEPVSEEEALALLSPVTTTDGEGWVADLTGSSGGKPARMVGCILPRGGRTWFYKMVGPAATVQAAREDFLNFMKGARHPTP